MHVLSFEFSEAMGGFMSVTGEVEGEPMKVGVPIHDLFAGLHGAPRLQELVRSRYLSIVCNETGRT